MKISRKYRKSAPEIRRFSVRRKISKPGDSWLIQEIWHPWSNDSWHLVVLWTIEIGEFKLIGRYSKFSTEYFWKLTIFRNVQVCIAH